MAADNVNIRITGKLRAHLQKQIGENGLYENASEYIRSLIRGDLETQEQSWEFLRTELEPALRASPDDFVYVSADDVIARNKKTIEER